MHMTFHSSQFLLQYPISTKYNPGVQYESYDKVGLMIWLSKESNSHNSVIILKIMLVSTTVTVLYCCTTYDAPLK